MKFLGAWADHILRIELAFDRHSGGIAERSYLSGGVDRKDGLEERRFWDRAWEIKFLWFQD